MPRRANIIDLPPKFSRRLDLSRPAVEQIISSLKTAILETNLAPGELISESEVGQFFGASRTPVREAFTSLKDQGLIVIYPSRGTYVSKLSISQIKGAQFVRESLEVSAATVLCERGLSQEVITELEDSLATQKIFIASGKNSAFQDQDDKFHATIANAVGHARILEIIQREKTCLDRLRVLSLNSPEHLTMLLADHHDIFDAIRSRDQIQTTRSVRKHLRRVLDTLTDLVQEHGDYFEYD